MAETGTGPTGPGLFYVNSKISKPDDLSPELFTKWYEEVHIPQIFKASTDGFDSGFRYYTTESEPVERPYLALYPLRNVKFLGSQEFFTLPAHSDILPGPNNFIFDVANFATRFYTLGDVNEPEGSASGPAPYITVADLDSPLNGNEVPSNPARVRQYNNYFAMIMGGAEGETETPPPAKHLYIAEFTTPEGQKEAAEYLRKQAKKVSTFNLLKAFGNTAHVA
ncbi:hypothetical protein P152DRAFT_475207 [Eremomyces bilateralis CBS 781.70]|uniref:EthD domain-containing protein n=1 Tax=Eremomyces bilateralis CBS 781.70 TaxID=1392243 RepID=A0A6G1FY92_9PEZI|nr:uncharacterized protein P152DRAFT_475207 [Eremomyces bilateralis CBS 781.70]KAF1810744.1 hypothetical protein P152DRAFT_475207 [Eremomyces bilateralis CBS 781.70]